MSDYKKSEELIKMLYSNLDMSKYNEFRSLKNKFQEIISKIKEKNSDGEYYYAGEIIKDHCKIVDFKNGMILIETDHPGWTQKIQFHKNFILTGLRNTFPELKIKNLSFRLSGDMFKLNDVQKEEKNELTLEQKQTEIKNFERISKENQNLPPELALKLEKLKNIILTKE
jgi:hypothetical protein